MINFRSPTIKRTHVSHIPCYCRAVDSVLRRQKLVRGPRRSQVKVVFLVSVTSLVPSPPRCVSDPASGSPGSTAIPHCWRGPSLDQSWSCSSQSTANHHRRYNCMYILSNQCTASVDYAHGRTGQFFLWVLSHLRPKNFSTAPEKLIC